MPSPIHESITSSLTNKIAVIIESLPEPISTRLFVSHNEHFHGFCGDWRGTKKTADLAIQVTNESGSQKYKWVLELGFSQSEKSLREDAMSWLKGVPTVSTVVTVSIVEEPSYRCPVSNNEDLKALGMHTDGADVDTTDFVLQEEYGPAIYKGRVWVGRISHVFWRTWTLDEGGNVKQRGHRKDLLPPCNPQIQIDLGELLTIPPECNGVVSVDLKHIRLHLKRSIQRQASDRYWDMLNRRQDLKMEPSKKKKPTCSVRVTAPRI